MATPPASPPISAKDLVSRIGRDSEPFQWFNAHWATCLSHRTASSHFTQWQTQFPTLSAHFTEPSEKFQLFQRSCYLLWVIRLFRAQIIPDYHFHKDYLQPFAFLESDLFELSPKNPLLVRIATDIPHFSQFGEREMFGLCLNQILELKTQEEKGMFFTPAPLAAIIVSIIQKRIKDINDTQILDPTCGPGGVLCQLLAEFSERSPDPADLMKQTGHLHGIDENPVALFAAETNLIALFARHDPQKEHTQAIDGLISRNFWCLNLFDLADGSHQGLPSFRFDIALGNLPWNVLNNVNDPDMRNRLIALSKQYGIYMAWKNQANLEIATILFEIIRTRLVKAGGCMAFFLPASLLTATQHAKFRRFSGLTTLSRYAIYPDYFPIHTMLLVGDVQPAQARANSLAEKKEIQGYRIDAPMDVEQWTQKFEATLSPASLKPYRKSFLVGKYIPQNSGTPEIPIEKSPYYPLVFRGVDITPRRLLFVSFNAQEYVDPNTQTVQVSPAQGLLRSTHSARWNQISFAPRAVEKRYIFPLVKSTEILPFATTGHHYAFLPIVAQPDGYTLRSRDELLPYARDHLQSLQKAYQSTRKDTAKNTTLAESLAYGNKLFQPAMASPLKVIYPVGGSYCKAAILREPSWLIDVTLYYLSPATEEEAYYLLAWLNSDYLRENLHRVCTVGASGSIRVIHLAPWQFPLPKFEPTGVFMAIAELGKKMEEHVTKLYTRAANSKNGVGERKKLSLQKAYHLLAIDGQYRTLQSQLSALLSSLFS